MKLHIAQSVAGISFAIPNLCSEEYLLPMPIELSYWEKRSLVPKVDIAVIGAGIVGLTAARILANRFPKKRIAVFEKNIIGANASSKNAGFACFGSISEIIADITKYGSDKVSELILLRRTGLQQLENRYGQDKLKLNYCGGYELFRDAKEFEKYAAHIDSINTLVDKDAKIFSQKEAPPSFQFYNQCIYNNAEGHLDTGLLYRALYQDTQDAQVEIYNGVNVSGIEEHPSHITIRTDQYGSIRTEQIVLTTNALTKDIMPEIEIEGTRNQVIVSTPIPNHGISGTFHLDEGYIYFRDIDDRILIGGGRHLFQEEATTAFGVNQANRKYLLAILQDFVLPGYDFSIAHQWSGLLATGPIKIPIVEKYSDRITIGVRLGGMGVAIGMKIGEDTATLVS